MPSQIPTGKGQRPGEQRPSLLDAMLPILPEPGNAPDRQTIERFERLLRPLSGWFRTELPGLEHIPREGPALLVTNHGPLGFDAIELVFGIFRKTGRMPRGLAERNLFRVGWVKTLIERLGHLAGTRENAVAALKDGDLVLVYPGGAREALKGTETRYQLAWDKARGFVRVALRAGAPIIPIAGIGVDDYYKVMKEPDEVARTLLGKTLVDVLGHEKYAPPGLLGLGPLPLPAKLRFVIGKPIPLDGYPPSTADDPAAVHEIREEVRLTLERMILSGLIRRGHPVWG